MAMLDNCSFLVNHIRNSFITSDETGMCEFILEADDVAYSDRLHSIPTQDVDNMKQTEMLSSSESDMELSHSLDIVSDMDLTGHRRRSNTAQRLEKLKLDKQKQSKIKHVRWKNPYHAVDELEEHFEKKSVSHAPAVVSLRKSALSLQLEQFDLTSTNPFMEYAKYDGRAGGSVPTKKIDIYLTMAPFAERAYPMTVVTLSTAKVQQLIGLICWQYTMENREPPLLETNVDAYSLNMVEDDGEVDSDFPPLDNREPITKFGFNKLALVAKVLSPHSAVKSKMQNINVQTADGCVYKLTVNTDSTLMRDILGQVLEMRNISQKTGQRYRLEKQTLLGAAIDLDLPLSTVNSTDFCLLRENSVWPGSSIGSQDKIFASDDLICQQYKSYDVIIVHKLRPSTAAQLGVSGDKIELNPSAGAVGSNRFTRSSFIFSKPKSMTFAIDDIAACIMHDEQTTAGHRIVQLIYNSDNHFKHCDLECETDIAVEIASQVLSILNCRPSAAQENYRLQRAAKLTRRHTVMN